MKLHDGVCRVCVLVVCADFLGQTKLMMWLCGRALSQLLPAHKHCTYQANAALLFRASLCVEAAHGHTAVLSHFMSHAAWAHVSVRICALANSNIHICTEQVYRSLSRSGFAESPTQYGGRGYGSGEYVAMSPHIYG
jgi:hypothetical protein